MTTEQDPYEDLDWDFDFTNKIDPPQNPTGDTVASATTVITPSTGVTLHSQALNGAKVKIWVTGLTDGVTYKLECRGVSVQGRKVKGVLTIIGKTS